jgi:maleate isomerase
MSHSTSPATGPGYEPRPSGDGGVSLGFGEHARIGHLYPSGGLVDYEVQLMAPDGVQLVTTRMPYRGSALADGLALLDDLEEHSRLLGDAEVDLIAMNCTAATLLAGADAVNERIRASTDIPSTTTIEAVLDGLSAVGARRIALMTPYVAEVTEAEIAFLGARGIEVTACVSDPCTTPVEQGGRDPGAWRELAGRLRNADADALLISCAGIRLAPVLSAIEEDFGRPVIASNPALLLKCLQMTGVRARPAGFGSLLAGAFE